MAGKRVLTRLLRVRELEEEMSRQALELAVSEQRRMQREIDAAQDLEELGRSKFVAELANPDTAGRVGGMWEIQWAEGRKSLLQPHLEAAEAEVERQREVFLERRTERRQVETCIVQERSLAEIEDGRRAQQMMDDWYGRRGPLASVKPNPLPDGACTKANPAGHNALPPAALK